MSALAAAKAAAENALDKLVLRAEGRVTLLDGILGHRGAGGTGIERGAGLVAGRPAGRLYVLVFCAAREVRHIVAGGH